MVGHVSIKSRSATLHCIASTSFVGDPPCLKYFLPPFGAYAFHHPALCIRAVINLAALQILQTLQHCRKLKSPLIAEKASIQIISSMASKRSDLLSLHFLEKASRNFHLLLDRTLLRSRELH